MTPAPASPPGAAPVAPEGVTDLRILADQYTLQEQQIRAGGGRAAVERQHHKGRLTARERVNLLVDGSPMAVPHGPQPVERFQELGLWAAHGMYAEHGGAPAAGVVTGIGLVHGRRCVIIANDATVKAGAFFPMTCKKIIRAQTIAMMARLPLVYLVDSAGVYLPLQEDVFPDADDFGRIFRNNAVISAAGIPQVAAIMGSCVAGGGYLPVLCDTLLMTEGSGLYLAGPALVKAAIGQEVSDEELGGAQMHAAVSGTIDFREKDDPACVARLRSLLGKYGAQTPAPAAIAPAQHPARLERVFTDQAGAQYDVRDLLAAVVDARADQPGQPDFDEYKAEYGRSIVCGLARLGGHAVGVVANQKKAVQRALPGGTEARSAVQMPGVIYDDSADKAARFVMDCNQRRVPIVFVHDTTGFMVGRQSEQGGIIRAGAKLVNAVSNSVVPKIVLITGGSYGAGNYAMCGRAFDQFLALAWPSAKCAVMGAAQATGTLAMIEQRSRERKGEAIDEATRAAILDAVRASYTEQQDIRHAAARGWIDRVIRPADTRAELIAALDAAQQGWDRTQRFATGVLQT
ncbi:MAG: methylcrotonoyl-CoA carboxylase [Planctomyces sp.]|nr:methylcrotonoyl-CoA carboxylase [Planctomyces sp.]